MDRYQKYRDMLGDDFTDEEYAKLADDNGLTIKDFLSKHEVEALRLELRKDKSFSDKEKFFLSYLLGLKPTLSQVGAAMGISGVAVKKIEEKAIGKLRKGVLQKDEKYFPAYKAEK